MTTSNAPAAAPFELQGLDGQTYRLEEALAQGPVVLAFFKIDCSACELAFPYLEKLAKAYPGGYQVWGISQDSAQLTRTFKEHLGLSFPLLLDSDNYKVSRAYDPWATPTIYYVSPARQIVKTSEGFNKKDLNEYSALVAEALGVEPEIVARPDDGIRPFLPG